MAESFWTVGQQVLVLFLLIGVGFVCGRLKLLNAGAVKCLADVVLYVAFPCVIVQSFMRRFDPSMLRGLLAAGAAALAVHVVSILIAHLVFRDKDEARRRVLRFCTVFSNAGYMALPLQSALLGETGVFYGAAYVDRLQARARALGVAPLDALATATRFTAECVRVAIEMHCAHRPEKLIVGGGGSLNPTLMAMLGDCLPGVRVLRNEDLGLDSSAKEAVAFALLANEYLFGHCGNVCRVTGAAHPVVLGKLSM